jgi:hypothetical protein
MIFVATTMFSKITRERMPVDATASCPQRKNKRSQIQHDGNKLTTTRKTHHYKQSYVCALKGFPKTCMATMNEAVPFKDFDVLNQTLGNLGD